MTDPALLPIFGVCPDDATTPFLERLWFRTDVLQAEDATEQLRGTRRSPRRSFEFPFYLSDDVRRTYASRVFANGAGLWQLPIWTDGVQLGATLTAGATTIPIDTTSRQFAEGFAIIRNGGAMELVAVSAVAVDALTVDATVDEWPAGSWVYPACIARFEGSWTGQAFTQAAEYGSARLVAMQANPFDAVAPSTLYRGLPVFPFCSKANEPAYGLERYLEAMDDDLGIPVVFDVAGIALPTQSVAVTVEGMAEIAELRGLIYWLDGMRGALWVSTYRDDLRVTANIGAAATQITVAACNYTADVDRGLNRRDIQITTKAGIAYRRRITACSAPGGGVELLTIDSALGADVAAADIAQVSFLQLMRSDSDVFELAWWNGPAVDCAFTFKGLRRDV